MIGNILKLIRYVNNDMSTKEVADKMGVRISYVCDIESGRKNVTMNTLQKFSNIYNIPVSTILLFDELQTKNNLTRIETLKNIVEYYINNVEKEKTR